MPVLFRLKDHFKENRLYLSRSVAVMVGATILLSVLVCRLFYLQVYHHATYVTLARNNQVRMISIAPTRGLIFDRNGVLLADNIPDFSLEISPNMVKDLDGLIERLAKIIKISEADIKSFHKQRRYKGRFERVAVRNKLTEEEVAAFSIEKYKFPEVDIHANLTRMYPFGEAFAHVLGYTGLLSEHDLAHIDPAKYRGTNVIGKYGIEKFYENTLRGNAGYEQVETDARGRMIRNLEQIAPTAGNNIYLSIDSKLQMAAYDALQNNKGAVVAIDTKTGGVLAMVSKPSFDPNLFVRGIPQDIYKKLQSDKERPLFHRAIRGQYAPGSTVKPLVTIKALETNVISTKTKFFDQGFYQIHAEGRMYRDWNKDGGRGWISVEQALTESCSTFFYFVADKLGIDRMHEVFTQFGLGSATHIDIDGEASGIAPSQAWKRKVKRQSWFQGETLITGIGQGYTLVTPLQMAEVASTIANRGVRMQPTLMKATQAPDQSITETKAINLTPIKLSQDEHWEIVIGAMEKAITDPRGTAHWSYRPRPKYTIAGKTGTTQVYGIKQDEEYDADKIKASLRDHKWFIAFAPVENPEIAVAVLIENNVGSPMVARKVFDAYFAEAKNGQ
jgi:penicillin-binding protein 2